MNYNKNPEEYGNKISIKELESLLRKAIDKYQNDIEIMNDNTFDKLLDILKRRAPLNKLLQEIGAPIRNDVKKIVLPYWMGSMDKATDNKTLNRFINKYNNNFSISEKLDGLSGLLIYKPNTSPILTTRGNGKTGQDISYLIPYLNLPNLNKDLVIRGEFIISKAKFVSNLDI